MKNMVNTNRAVERLMEENGMTKIEALTRVVEYFINDFANEYDGLVVSEQKSGIKVVRELYDNDFIDLVEEVDLRFLLENFEG